MAKRDSAVWTVVGLVAVGCAAPPAAPPPAPSQPAPPVSTVPDTAPPPAASSAPVEAGPPPDAAPPDPFAGTSFPPADFSPPHERSAKKGDGTWVRLGDAKLEERAAGDPPVLYRTTVQPHEVSKYVTVTVAAIDLEHTALHLVAGTDDPGADQMPEGHPPGLVPESDQQTLVAVFNGGFKPQHGGWGMKIEGKELVPPKPEGCTVVLNDDGTVAIRSWPAVADEAKKAHAYRQTPPCLLQNGEVHPDLVAGNTRVWAGQSKNRKTRRRSALGIDASGRNLFFGVGVEAEPKLLAEAMKHAGAAHATQLDINWNWTRFLLFGTIDGELQVTSTLIPQMVHRKQGYVRHTQPRDFFYLTRR